MCVCVSVRVNMRSYIVRFICQLFPIRTRAVARIIADEAAADDDEVHLDIFRSLAF